MPSDNTAAITAARRVTPVFEPLNLIDLLRRRAAQSPGRLAYTFLSDGTRQAASITYSELDRRARAIGAWLESRGAADQRVLLLFPSGIEYIAAFFGCLYARAVAVPAYPPRPNRQFDRVEAISHDAKPALILTARQLLPQMESLLAGAPELKAATLRAVEDIEDHLAEAWREPVIAGDTLAFLQYTSGSTAAPKGVMITHANLLDNERMIRQAFGQTEESIIAGWLPLFHDMGLIGNLLQALYAGAHCILLSPAAFLRNPSSWLETVSRYRVTTSGGPNFAYELCARKIGPEQREALDLSSWRTAFCGAEPIRKETLDRFAAVFSVCGFRPQAFHPCYGLAEATLFVSGGRSRGPLSRSVRGEALKQNRLEPAAAGDSDVQNLVSCGKAGAGARLKIVDALSHAECPAGRVGEIWVAGKSIAKGYWNQPEESRHTFQAYLPNGDGPFLRTGDLGIIQDEELYVTGRLKDLIIIRGRNHYPQDIELTVERCHPGMRPGGGAAFSVEAGGEERLIIVQEIEKRYHKADLGPLMEAIRGAVAEEHEIQVHGVILSKPGSVPKTSSGKVQRSACRLAFRNGALDALETSLAGPAGDPPEDACEAGPLREEILALCSGQEQVRRLEHYLHMEVARALGLAPAHISLHQPLTRLGLDSLKAIELQTRIETALNIGLPMSSFLQDGDISQLALLLRMELSKSLSKSPAALDGPVQSDLDAPLSYGQQRLWFLDQLTPHNPAYNIAIALRLTGQVNSYALEQAISEIAARHDALRTVFRERQGQPYEVVRPAARVRLPLVDLRGGSANQFAVKGAELAAEEARRPFELSQGPLLRVTWLRSSAQEGMLLLTLHHIIGDAWSLGVFLEELAALYRAYLAGAASALAPLPVQYTDFARWQRQQLPGEALQAQLAYWRRKCQAPAMRLELPMDRTRPAKPAADATCHWLILPKSLSDDIKNVSRQENSTPFMTLLAGFYTVLHHYTGRSDISLGSPIAGRNRAEFKKLIGFFVNTLVLRIDLSGDPTFRQLLGRVREMALEAYANQDLPFEQLVSAVCPERNISTSPLYRVWFGLHLGSLPTLRLPALTMIPIEMTPQAAKVDLAAHLVEHPDGITGKFEYNNELFEPGGIATLAEDFQAVLETAVSRPDLRLRAFEQSLRRSREAAHYEDALHRKLQQARRRTV